MSRERLVPWASVDQYRDSALEEGPGDLVRALSGQYVRIGTMGRLLSILRAVRSPGASQPLLVQCDL